MRLLIIPLAMALIGGWYSFGELVWKLAGILGNTLWPKDEPPISTDEQTKAFKAGYERAWYDQDHGMPHRYKSNG